MTRTCDRCGQEIVSTPDACPRCGRRFWRPPFQGLVPPSIYTGMSAIDKGSTLESGGRNEPPLRADSSRSVGEAEHCIDKQQTQAAEDNAMAKKGKESKQHVVECVLVRIEEFDWDIPMKDWDDAQRFVWQVFRIDLQDNTVLPMWPVQWQHIDSLLRDYMVKNGDSGGQCVRIKGVWICDDPDDCDMVEVYSHEQVCRWVFDARREARKYVGASLFSDYDRACVASSAVSATAPQPMLRLQFGF